MLTCLTGKLTCRTGKPGGAIPVPRTCAGSTCLDIDTGVATLTTGAGAPWGAARDCCTATSSLDTSSVKAPSAGQLRTISGVDAVGVIVLHEQNRTVAHATNDSHDRVNRVDETMPGSVLLIAIVDTPRER